MFKIPVYPSIIDSAVPKDWLIQARKLMAEEDTFVIFKWSGVRQTPEQEENDLRYQATLTQKQMSRNDL